MLTRNQRLTIFLLISGFSNSEIAAQIGVHPKTVRRWLKDPLFAEALQTETTHAWQTARAQSHCAARRLMDNATAAMRALQPILLGDKTDPKVVVRAADVTLRNAPRWMEVLDEDARVPMLNVESSEDFDSDDVAEESESEESEESDDAPAGDTVREEEAAQIAAIARKLDGKAHPHMNEPEDETDRGDDVKTA